MNKFELSFAVNDEGIEKAFDVEPLPGKYCAVVNICGLTTVKLLSYQYTC